MSPRSFQIGDRVILSSNDYSISIANPIWTFMKIVGTVRSTSSIYNLLPISVEWDNGQANMYYHEDLELFSTVKIHPKRFRTFAELVKSKTLT